MKEYSVEELKEKLNRHCPNCGNKDFGVAVLREAGFFMTEHGSEKYIMAKSNLEALKIYENTSLDLINSNCIHKFEFDFPESSKTIDCDRCGYFEPKEGSRNLMSVDT
jgi:ribosomal protein S27AE